MTHLIVTTTTITNEALQEKGHNKISGKAKMEELEDEAPREWQGLPQLTLHNNHNNNTTTTTTTPREWQVLLELMPHNNNNNNNNNKHQKIDRCSLN